MFHRYIVLKYLTHDMWTEKNKKKSNNTLFFYIAHTWRKRGARAPTAKISWRWRHRAVRNMRRCPFSQLSKFVESLSRKWILLLGPGGTWQTLVTCDASDDNKISEYISSYLVRLPVRIPFLFWPYHRWCNRCTGIYRRCQPSALGNAEMHFFHQLC